MAFNHPDLSSRRSPFTVDLKSLSAGYKGHAIYFAMIFSALILWGIGVYVLYRTVGGPDLAMSSRLSVFQTKMTRLLIVFFTVFSIVRTIQFISMNHEKSLAGHLIHCVKSDPFWLPRSALFGMIGAASFLYLQVNFMSVKTAIPVMQPFYFDDIARKMDYFIFLGNDPWVIFSKLYELPQIMKLIDVTYTLWSTLIVGFWIYAFTTNRISRQRRFQYIFAMILIWFVAGNVLATVLSSAGPCYYHLFGNDPSYYAPLMAQLGAVHDAVYIDAFSYQDVLLAMYDNPETRLGGISAAPSLHVGSSLILLMFFWKNKITRNLMILFNIVIFVGSIVLAWHYAVDGLIAAPVALGCWLIAGKLTKKIEHKLAAKQQLT